MEEFHQRAKDLLKEMTLEEKVSQMLHQSAGIKRLDIPAYNWWNEALHGVGRSGVATMFPQAIGLAAMFDVDLLKEIADVIATEGRAKFHEYQKEEDRDIYKGLTFWSPNINIFRDPRWGRGHETYGEDPYLTSRLGVAFIHGLQGDKEQLKVAACAKHFAVHSGPEAIRHSFNAECDAYDLWNTYLPAFEVAVKEGKVEAVMGAYNRTLGEPCCGSPFLLQKILREKWGFSGHVVSDCWAIKDFYLNHGVTSSPVASVALAVKSGCDINCGNLFIACLSAVEQGLLTEQDIDQAVERLLVTRMKLGLLGAKEEPSYTSIPYQVVDSKAHRELNLKAARRSLVLLKNDGSLPLDAKKIQTIGVIGPNADSAYALEGNYQGTASEHITPLVGIRQLAEEKGIRVMYAQGCHLYKKSMSGLSLPDDRFAEARIVAKHSDAVVVCLGLDADIEGEEGDTGNEFSSGDKNTLDLPGRQQALLEAVVSAAKGKPVIVVLISGSALSVNWADEHTAAVLQAFYPGALGGRAIAEVLFGEVSPSGKLPVTFYRDSNELPDFTNYEMKGRTYRYFEGHVLYPFGYGLTYESFALRNLEATKEKVKVTVQNQGKRKAHETVQVYVHLNEQKEKLSLCAFAGVDLEAGESRELVLPLSINSFARYDENGDLKTIKGEHQLFVGFTQPDLRSVELYGQKPLEIVLSVS
ncbi:glycosyl hydrolase [Clostridia bacterium]|nr:glycosyl hydrolase [Clostridia bacterium]